MRDNPFHSFVLFLTGQIGDQLNAGAWRWPTVVVFWLLLLAAIAIAITNWRQDPDQRSLNHLFLAGMRLLGAGMWFCASLWKLPLPVSQGFQFWMESSVKFSSWQWHADIMQLFLDHITIVGPLVYLLELSIAASLMLGFMVRLSNTIGALFILNLLIALFNDPSEWVWTYVGLIGMFAMFANAQVGRSLGLDNLVAKRLLPVFQPDNTLTQVLRLAS